MVISGSMSPSASLEHNVNLPKHKLYPLGQKVLLQFEYNTCSTIFLFYA